MCNKISVQSSLVKSKNRIKDNCGKPTLWQDFFKMNKIESPYQGKINPKSLLMRQLKNCFTNWCWACNLIKNEWSWPLPSRSASDPNDLELHNLMELCNLRGYSNMLKMNDLDLNIQGQGHISLISLHLCLCNKSKALSCAIMNIGGKTRTMCSAHVLCFLHEIEEILWFYACGLLPSWQLPLLLPLLPLLSVSPFIVSAVTQEPPIPFQSNYYRIGHHLINFWGRICPYL